MMFDKQIIESEIAQQRFDKAIEMLDHNIEREPLTPHWWYLRGKVYWRLGQRGKAISDYEEAAHLDPESPAVQALQMSKDIMDFYNTDLYNP